MMQRSSPLHLDEARSQLISKLRYNWDDLQSDKILIIEDAFGRFSLAAWGKSVSGKCLQKILNGVSPYDASVFFADDEFDVLDLKLSWEEAMPVDDDDDDKIRLIVRHRMLPAWQSIRPEPLWPASEGSPLVAFYSFKGGMGRSTALAAFALDRVQRDEHVVVVDLDLDAPGLGSLLPSDVPSPYGVVDYLIEEPVLGKRPDDLLDYSWLMDLEKIRTSGSLRVFPAGTMDLHYLGKMARLDFEKTEGLRHPLEELLLQIRETWKPDWILLDSRTGFSETAGMVLSGLAHFHVLVGVDSEQSWDGLAYAIRKLGSERLHRDLPQAEVLLLQGLVPELKRDQKNALLERFQERAEDLFREGYYLAEEGERDDNFWYLDDASSSNAPHRALALDYVSELAQSASVSDLIDALDSPRNGYAAFCAGLAERITRGGK